MQRKLGHLLANRRFWLSALAAPVLVLAFVLLTSDSRAALPSQAPRPPADAPTALDTLAAQFDCNQISAHSIDKQLNPLANAIMAKCGKAGAGLPAGTIGGVFKSLPGAYGGPDVNVHPPTSPNIQSESFVWGNGNTIF